MKRLFGFGLLAAGLALSPAFAAETLSNKEALQELHEFIGTWNGNGGAGTPESPKAAVKPWKETIEWGWKFKGEDTCLVLSIKDGKQLKGGELRYLPGKKVYQLKAKDLKDNEMVFEGAMAKGYLTLEHTDPTTKAVQQIKMNTAGDGVRFVVRYLVKPAGRTLFAADSYVAGNKEGEALAAVKGKNTERDCIVSGGLGTGTVTYKGMTFYVCCSGCRDEFNANPEKYYQEWLAKKKK